MKTTKSLLLALLLLFFNSLNAQDNNEALSQQAANPLADLMSFPFQNNLNINHGPFNRNVNVLNIQPVIPFAGGRIITRTIFPIVRIPDFSQESGGQTAGLSDIVFTTFYVPESQGVTWGVGPVIEIPTGGADRGTQLYYNVVRPDFGPEWQWRFQVQVLLPKRISKN